MSKYKVFFVEESVEESENVDTPTFEAHIEIDGDNEKFGEDVFDVLKKITCDTDQKETDWIDHCSSYSAWTVRVECGSKSDWRDGTFCCGVDQMIAGLLYCCKKSVATVKKIKYIDKYIEYEYTDIKSLELFGNVDTWHDGITTSECFAQFDAKGDGDDQYVYLFGHVVPPEYWSDARYVAEPCEIVVAEEKHTYIGTYTYITRKVVCDVDVIDMTDPDVWVDVYDDEGEWAGRELSETVDFGEYETSDIGTSRVFLKTDGKDVTFSVSYTYKLYKKISKNDKNVIFCYTPHEDCWTSSEFKQDSDPKDTYFKKVDGEYRYSNENKDITESAFGKPVFTPPQMPDLDNIDKDSARKLYEAYIDAFYEAFANAEEYKIPEGVFKRVGDADHTYCAEINDLTLIGKFAYNAKYAEEWYDDGKMNSELDFDIERVSFNYDDIEVSMIHSGDNSLGFEINDTRQNNLFQVNFDEYRKRGIFSDAGLPETIQFNKSLESFLSDIEIYKKIKDAIIVIIEDDPQRLAWPVRRMEVDYKEMERKLYEKGMIPDWDVIDFAIEMKNKFYRTDEIPNIAVVGEAGTGKTTMVKKLGGLFDKEVMCISPADLKGAYIGHTLFKVVECIADAARDEQILFIDEAYELLSDSFGAEAVAILLPLMSGDRKKIHATRDQDEIECDFEQGKIKKRIKNTEKPEEHIKAKVPPIWIGGYEDDIRLMLCQNQGLYRRYQRLTLVSPTVEELYTELTEKLEKAREKLKRGEDSELLNNYAKLPAPMKKQKKEQMQDKFNTLRDQFSYNEKAIKDFFRWGIQPQNSKYFANHAGVRNFLDRCIDRIDSSKNRKDIALQIEEIIFTIKRDVKHQLDTVRRRGDASWGGANGRSRKTVDDSDRVAMIYDNETRFKDLIGCDEQIEYMKSIIDMFVNKGEYKHKKITIPKGVLLLGAPGVGKTFIARAMAGELQEAFKKRAEKERISKEESEGELKEKFKDKIGFMSLSAPELTSKPVSFIGSIFDKAEEYEVCVIFIDEVDAIAKNRFQNEYYSHFIELIKQMDSIEQRSNVFILAATNAYESLDPAFIRSGRIDKQLSFTLPDTDARCKLAQKNIIDRCGVLINFDVKNEKNQKDVEVVAEETAKITLGYTPGDIENIINAAFLAYDREERSGTRNNGKKGSKIKNPELECLCRNIYEEVERKDIGSPNPAKKESKFLVDKNNSSCSAVSIHEVGHALVGILCDCEPFEKITTLPRGNALGYVVESRTVPLTKKDYENRIRVAMGGRISEELIYGEENISAGAVEDIKMATNFARRMVEELGFVDEFKFMAITESHSRHLGVNGYNCSESFREQSDTAVNELLKRLYQETRRMLADKKTLIITLAKEVFNKETMTGEEFKKFYEKNQLKK